MSDLPYTAQQLETEHTESYYAFERLVLFAAIHVVLTFICVALAVIGRFYVLALMVWLLSSLVLIPGVALAGRKTRFED